MVMASPGGGAPPGRATGAGRAIPSASAPSGPAVITGLSGSGPTAHFTDQYGQPRLLLADTPWDLLANAGMNNTSWQADIDGYCNARGPQGFTAAEIAVFSSPANSTPYTAGGTWDGVLPFTGNNPGQLNSAFWARVDYFIAGCARNGITAWLNLAYGDNFTAGPDLEQYTLTQMQNFGAALAARYASTANIMWQYGGDYFGNTTDDAILSAILTGLRGGGDSHVISIENSTETTSRQALQSPFGTETWGAGHAQYSSVYTYIQTYFGIRYAYLTEASPLPAIWVDGLYYKSGAASPLTYFDLYDRGERQMVWWALSSGARGVNCGSEGVWPWSDTVSGSGPGSNLFEVTNEYYYAFTAGNIRRAVEALPGWWKLLPDNGVLITAGAGTPVATDSGVHYGETFTDSYVTASYAADGSLALIYLSHATAITIDQTKMRAGYTAKWIDPDSGASYAGTTGSTYNSGAADGSKAILNSVGDPDWVLALIG